MRLPRPLRVSFGFALAGLPAASTAQAQSNSTGTPEVVVVEAAPLMGSGVDVRRMPSDAQHVDASEIEKTHPVGLNGVLATSVGGAVTSDVQNNPLQPDVSFRGFSASPLLGVPQGLSVYQNGVRANDAFGDNVQWDLVPEFAIASLDVLPGSNPVYGLNTLGGAVALRMKNGFRYHGAHVSTEAGSFGRSRSLVESGGQRDDLAVYSAGEVFAESGFRDHSPSTAGRLYLDIRQRTETQEVGASVTAVDDYLVGNGPLPIDLLRRDRSAIYTYPDITRNRMLMMSIEGSRRLSPSVSVQAMLYARRAIRTTSNGDEATFGPCTANGAILCDAGNPLVATDGAAVPVSQGGTGVLNTTRTSASSFGASVQTSWSLRSANWDNRLIVGQSIDGSPIAFSRDAEVGTLAVDRGVVGSGTRLAGEAFETRLAVSSLAVGLYGSDTLTFADRLSLTASGRLNAISLRLEDQDGSALTGSHSFVRANPALGAAFRFTADLALFGGYAESSRAPTAAELACADPNVPCRVPNAFLSDPPLKQVISRSVEVGIRGGSDIGPVRMSGSIAGFGQRSSDDILFVPGALVGTGFFTNAGTTQRAGLEANIRGRFSKTTLFLRYQFLRATFETPLTLPGENHPDATVDASGRRTISITPGDSIPGLPTHLLKVGATTEPFQRMSLGVSGLLVSSSYYRGDESNQIAPVPGYFVVNADAAYKVLSRLTLFLEARNLLGAKYETFGALGDATSVIPSARNPRFLSPGAPFGLWAGIDVRLD